MNIKEILGNIGQNRVNEAISLESTVNAIISDIGRPTSNVYETLGKMAKKIMHDSGELRGYPMVAGGVKSRWYQTFYFGKMRDDLHHLLDEIPKSKPSHKYLRDFLSSNYDKMSDVEAFLPNILIAVGDDLGIEKLKVAASKWLSIKKDLSLYMEELKEAESNDEELPDFILGAKRAEVTRTPSNSSSEVNKDYQSTVRQQNEVVEKIVRDTLARLPKDVAGDIRRDLARSNNKLADLEKELMRRNIKL